MKLVPAIFISVALFFGSLIYISFAQRPAVTGGISSYEFADSLFNRAKALPEEKEKEQEELNARALNIFKSLLRTPRVEPDGILPDISIKAGLLEHYFDNVANAEQYYLAAIRMRPRLKDAADSVFFKAYLFAGSILQTNGKFDSAFAFYREAESIAAKYDKPLQDNERLYNRLGAINYETGNYRLAENYFSKALKTLSPQNTAYTDLLINYKLNLGAIAINLEDYSAARTYLASLLPYREHENSIHQNLGIIELRTRNYAAALAEFRMAARDVRPSVQLLTNFAEAFDGSNDADSVDRYTALADEENARINGKEKTAAYGMLLELRAKRFADENNFERALQYHAEAIMQFYPAFADSSPMNSPKEYKGIFSFRPLFQSLSSKAKTAERAYEHSGDPVYLELAVTAYKSAYRLTDYVSAAYSSDEAHLFLGKIKYAIHDRAINTAIALYDHTHLEKHLETAWFFDQYNKASALAYAINEAESLRSGSLLVTSKIAGLRQRITRLALTASRNRSNEELPQLTAELRDAEIEFSRLRDSLPRLQFLQEEHTPGTRDLQKLLPARSVLLSYHLSKNRLLVFAAGKKTFSYRAQKIDSNFFRQLTQFKDILRNTTSGVPEDRKIENDLYRILFADVLRGETKIERLIIIPDDELNFIPFEALRDDAGQFLIQKYAVQYALSASFLLPPPRKKSTGFISFAPFANRGNAFFSKLPASANETEGLSGTLLQNEQATKSVFLKVAPGFETLHLATHAEANDTLPLQSYVAFSPGNSVSDSNKLYAGEIYGIDLSKVRLVVLSACETGTGALVKGEGLLSLTRAFSYAGCNQIVASLWKANDYTTARIANGFHRYRDAGLSTDKALQKAKTDFLNDPAVSPSLKKPGNWAHLVLTGSLDRPKTGSPLFLSLIAAFAFIFIALAYVRKRKKSR